MVIISPRALLPGVAIQTNTAKNPALGPWMRFPSRYKNIDPAVPRMTAGKRTAKAVEPRRPVEHAMIQATMGGLL
jgi:hypothetical protein